MSKTISIDEELVHFLDSQKDTPRDEDGMREESYSIQIKRMLNVKKVKK